MSKTFLPVLRFDLIQSLRLAHALMESRFEICIPEADAEKFVRLKEFFGAEYVLDETGAKPLVALNISHANPTTSVGEIERPLVFPHSILRHCKTLWKSDRDIGFSFAGNLGKTRTRVLKNWCRINFPESRGGFPNPKPRWYQRLGRNKKKKGNGSNSCFTQIGDLMLWSSTRGRTFPDKSWDQEYFDVLARSRFVLCPNGDFVWSYRFFEAILCGAIPVIEEYCDLYEGFVFQTMDDPVEDLSWDADVVEQNYALCVERISIPLSELNAELAKLV